MGKNITKRHFRQEEIQWLINITLMYQLEMDTATNQHKLGCLKEQTFMLPHFQSPRIRNQLLSANMEVFPQPSGGSRGESIPCFFLSDGCQHPIACGHITSIFAFVFTSILFFLSNLLLPLSCNDTCACIQGPPNNSR